MKQLLSVLIVAALMAACNSNPQTSGNNTKALPAADTAGLSQFQAWKAQQAAKTLDEANKATEVAPATSTKETAVKTKTTVHHSPDKTQSMSYESANAAKQKKGWSKTAKGAVIGAASGALIGVELDKHNRTAGGVIGGVVGGATGAGIGHHEDKKDGRNN